MLTNVMRKSSLGIGSLCLILATATVAVAETAPDNQLTEKEKAAGWLLLFNGKNLDGWLASDLQPGRRSAEEGAINPHKCGAYMMIHEKVWENYQLALDFKISPKCNSGIFLHTFPITPRLGNDVGYNGLEIAIDDTKTAGYHDTGALYDLVPPKRNAMKPVGEWNHIVITCRGKLIDVELNGEAVMHANLEEWTEKNKRPDGSNHKFEIAFKDKKPSGYIGLQDHGGECWFKNIKLLPLKTEK